MLPRLQTIKPRKFPFGEAAAISTYPFTCSTALALWLSLSAMDLFAANPASASFQGSTFLSTQIFGVPLQFEKNLGQTDPRVDFLARGPGYTLFLTPTQAVFCLGSAKSSGGDAATLEMVLVTANPNPGVEGLDELPGRTSYFLGSNPENWRSGIHTFARIKYHEAYPGIDLLYYGNQRQLEYDFIVAPRADAERIELKIDGAENLEINTEGALVAFLKGKKVTWHPPLAFQETDTGRKEIPARFTFKKNRHVGFQIAAYDRSKTLVIDPALVYATYLGGTGDEISFNSFAPNGVKVALDTNGNVFVVGQTVSRNFPTRNAYDSTPNGTDTNLCDVFVTKFNAAGNALIYSTYLGGVSNDVAGAIAVDSAGNAYITGSTESPDFPHINAFQSVNNGFNDIFVTKLSSNGMSIVYSTFLGGGQDEFGRAIAVDSTGNAYITGKSWSKGTGSSPYPTSHGAFQTDNGGGNTYSSDAIAAKFDPTGAMIYSTFLGGHSEEEGNAIAVDSAGNACIAGQVLSTTTYPAIPTSDFPILNAFQPNFNNGGTNLIFLYDGFLTKLNAAGTALIFSTFLGGEEDDTATGVTLDSKGRIYVTGSTSSSSFPSTSNAVQTANAGASEDPLFPGSDAFVTIFETNGASLVYSTYLGGTDFEEGDSIRLSRFGIAVDNFNCVYVVGQTSSFDFPLTTGADQTNSNAANDVFVAKINPAVPGPAGLIYSTLLSGSIGTVAGGAINEAEAIAVDAGGNFYVAGVTTATNFPVTAGAYAVTNKGGYDVFLAKYASPRDLSVVMSGPTSPVTVGSSASYTIQINNNGRATFTGVTNIVQIPSNMPIVSVSASTGNINTNTSGKIILNIGNMTNNAAVTETIVIGTTSPGTMNVTSTVSSIETATLEPNTGNNVSSVVTTIRGIADVKISTAFAAPNPVIVGSNLTYTITVANKGPWPATSVVMTDTLPASLTFVSAVTDIFSSYTYDTNNPGVVSFSFVTLTNGGAATVMINVTPTAPGVVANNVAASAYESDLNIGNNSSNVLATVDALTDVALGMSGPSTGLAGSNVTFTLRVTNRGPYAASSTIVSDPVPAGASYVSATTSQGTLAANNGIVTWTLGNIANNGVATLTATFRPAMQGVLSNTAAVTNSAAAIDLVTSNNSASFVTTINPAADLAILQAVTPNPPLVTSNFTISVVVTNQGPSTSANVIVTNILPQGLQMLPFQPPPGATFTQANGVLTCNLGSLTNSASVALSLMFYAATDGSFTNTASVSSTTPDLNPSNTSTFGFSIAQNPNAPLLKVTRSGSNVVLFWSTNAVGFMLQSRTNFAPSSSWTAVTNTRAIGAQVFSTNNTSAGKSFYRLIK